MLKMLTTYKPAWFSYNIANGAKGELKMFTDIGIKFSFLHLFKYILSKVAALEGESKLIQITNSKISDPNLFGLIASIICQQYFCQLLSDSCCQNLYF